MSWLEKRTVWALGWDDGRKPGLLYFLLNPAAGDRRARARRLAASGAAVLAGLVLADPRVLAGGPAVLLPPVVATVWTFGRTFHLTRRLLASGLLRELAVTPVGPAEVLRDVHLTAVRRAGLAGLAWLAGHLFLMPAGPEGLGWALFFLLLLPGLLWRLSAVAAASAIGSESWRPAPETLRRAMIAGGAGLLLLLAAVVFPPLLLLAIGLKRGSGLFLLLVPLALAPGLSAIGGLIWWLRRKGIEVDVGRLLTANAARVREMIDRRLDL